MIADILKLALKVVCDAHGIAPRLVASSADIEAIAAGEDRDVPAMKGWRRKLFGETWRSRSAPAARPSASRTAAARFPGNRRAEQAQRRC